MGIRDSISAADRSGGAIRANARFDLRRQGLYLEDIDNYADELTMDQRRAVTLRYGLLTTRSWEHVARLMGCSREHARQLGKRGLRAIRKMVVEDLAAAPRSAPVKTAKGPWNDWDAEARRVDRIADLLYQSGFPSEARLEANGIETVVNVSGMKIDFYNEAREYVECRLSDADYLPSHSLMYELAHAAAESVLAGRKTLINCQMGWNRSGLIMGVTIWMLTGVDGVSVVKTIRAGRPNALGNRLFKAFLESLPAVDGGATGGMAKSVLRHLSSREKQRELLGRVNSSKEWYYQMKAKAANAKASKPMASMLAAATTA